VLYLLETCILFCFIDALYIWVDSLCY